MKTKRSVLLNIDTYLQLTFCITYTLVIEQCQWALDVENLFIFLKSWHDTIWS